MMGAVFLSASIPDPKRSPAYAQTSDTVAITAAVAALIHVVLGRRLLVWGGHPAITPMIWTVAQDLGVDYGSWVHLYQSRFFEDEFPEDNERYHNVHYVDAVPDDLALSLLAMRVRMLTEHQFQAGVFIGGMDGILHEYELLRNNQKQATIVPLVSTGGAARELGERLRLGESELALDLNYVALLHRVLGVSVRERRYRTPDEQPKEMQERFWEPPT